VDKTTPRSLYAAFDTFPAPKGAAVHIQHMAKALFEFKAPGALYVLMDFGDELTQWLKLNGHNLELCHFRDPWAAFPIIDYKHRNALNYKTIYEVNGLPSIELPYAYPHIADATIAKITAQENFCLRHANHLITPSETTRHYLLDKGIATSQITLIRNGAECVNKADRPINAPKRYLLYFGALQQWQGIDDLLRAFSLLADVTNLELVICASKHNRVAKQYRKMADKLGLQNKIHWYYGLQKPELQQWIYHAYLSIAPLIDCSRNSVQGCCPLKIIESMAAGTPVVASNLRVVNELISDRVDGRLYRPGRADDLARIVRVLLENPDETARLGANAKHRINENASWTTAELQLKKLYLQLTDDESKLTYQHDKTVQA